MYFELENTESSKLCVHLNTNSFNLKFEGGTDLLCKQQIMADIQILSELWHCGFG